VPSGGFAAGSFSEGSLTIGSIGCDYRANAKVYSQRPVCSPPFYHTPKSNINSNLGRTSFER
jgi:hypothetical protein